MLAASSDAVGGEEEGSHGGAGEHRSRRPPRHSGGRWHKPKPICAKAPDLTIAQVGI